MSISFGSTYMIELQKCFKIDSKYLVINIDHPDSHASVNSLIGSLTGIHCYLQDKKNTEVAKATEDFIINSAGCSTPHCPFRANNRLANQKLFADSLLTDESATKCAKTQS